jgi:regulator of RNase E activity RraA
LDAIPEIKDISRPPRALVDALAKIGTATLASELSRQLGIRDPQIRGPRPLVKGRTVAGPALTLQCMPKREDLYTEAEYENPELQLHRHVLYPTQPGDVVVVDARGDLASGIFGEMMLTFFAGRGGVGVVIDGCIRDSAEAAKLDLGVWVKGVTPNYHAQTNIVPFAVNVPVACANVLAISSLATTTALWSCRSASRRDCWRSPASTSSGRNFPACASPRAATCASTTRLALRARQNTRNGTRRSGNVEPAARGAMAAAAALTSRDNLRAGPELPCELPAIRPQARTLHAGRTLD